MNPHILHHKVPCAPIVSESEVSITVPCQLYSSCYTAVQILKCTSSCFPLDGGIRELGLSFYPLKVKRGAAFKSEMKGAGCEMTAVMFHFFHYTMNHSRDDKGVGVGIA